MYILYKCVSLLEGLRCYSALIFHDISEISIYFPTWLGSYFGDKNWSHQRWILRPGCGHTVIFFLGKMDNPSKGYLLSWSKFVSSSFRLN